MPDTYQYNPSIRNILLISASLFIDRRLRLQWCPDRWPSHSDCRPLCTGRRSARTSRTVGAVGYRNVQDLLIDSYFQQTCAPGRVQCEDGARLHWGTQLSELRGCCTGHCLQAHTCASRIQGVLQLQVQRYCRYTLEASRILHTLHHAHLPAQQECPNAVGRGANVLRFRLGTHRSL